MVITVSRQYGSRGERIAQCVAKKLGYSYFDKDILADVARAAKTTEEQIRLYDERSGYGFHELLKKLFTPNYPPAVEWLHYAPELYLEWSPEDAVKPTLDADEVTLFFRRVIESLWMRGNAVIVGRGSQKILADKPNTVHVRVSACIDDRVDHVMASEGLIYPRAVKQIKAIDKQREHYLKHYYDANWTAAKLYHLVLNTSLMSIEQAVGTIVATVCHQENELSYANQIPIDEPSGTHADA